MLFHQGVADEEILDPSSNEMVTFFLLNCSSVNSSNWFFYTVALRIIFPIKGTLNELYSYLCCMASSIL